ncbi:sensor histidine kinase [Micromonospora craterilacus]|uniref:sensor histidine kinase n=1 Tax=Micromonospora craterilacus TaxID=1655439 RepID=UPI0011B53CEF|nr:sensor histidine kinase [Micromonospora craterilacus]
MYGKRLVAYLAAATVLVAAGFGVYLAVIAGDASATTELTVGVLLGLSSVLLGLAVATRRPGNVVGLLLVFTGAVVVGVVVNDLYPAAVAVDPRLPVSGGYVDLVSGVWMLLYVPPALLFLLVPEGRLPGRRWRWVVVGLLVVPPLFILTAAFDPTPAPQFPGIPKAFRAPAAALDVIALVSVALLPIFLGLLVASLVSIVVRYRRTSSAVERAQLKWFVLGASFLPLTLLLCWASYLVFDRPELGLVGLIATYLAIPASTTIALLKHDLYDVDRALSATATYGLVTAILLAFYTVASFVVGLGAGRGSPAAAAAATAVCAAALAPMRNRLQRFVDHRLYPARQAALAAIEDLRRRTDVGSARPEQLERVLRTALRDPSLRVGYRLPGSATMLDTAGHPVEPARDRPGRSAAVRLGDTDIGIVVADGAASRELLREVASASSLLVEVVRLRAELASALSAVRGSRARLLAAGYEERRRIERDLHDGAQQRLVTLGMRLRLAQRHLDDGTVDVDGLLDQSVAELGNAIVELRQIAHGLRPSSLDDGLDHALGAMVSQLPVPVTLDLRAADAIPEDLATTAYYVVTEAVTNAVKHAQPTAIDVSVGRDAEQLTVRVRDDGAGGAVVRPGSGLGGLADRVAAAGGWLRIASPVGGGTAVEAVLPCES